MKMFRSAPPLLPIATVVALASACLPHPSPGVPESTVASTDPQEAARASRELGWAALLTGGEGNATISPSSFALSLGLLAQGTSGDALARLDPGLGLTGISRGEALSSLRHQLGEYDSLPSTIDPKEPPADPIVHQASQVTAVGDARIEPEFTRLVEEMFGATSTRVAASDLKAALDAWVTEHTAGLIEESAIAASPALELVIQDAVLFASAWAHPFTTSNAWLEFHAPDGIQELDALGGTFHLAHASSKRWEAVRLPYDDRLAMDVVLPAEDLSPEDLDAADLEAAHRALGAAGTVKVAVTMPAADLRTQHDLLDHLSGLGVSLAGGLDGIFPGAQVSAMVQQARLEVNAKGTVGAAVTEMAVVTGAPLRPERIVEFTVDRPYVMNVADTRTGWPLFLAKVSDAEAAQASSS